MPIASITVARDAIYSKLQTAMAASAYSTVPLYYPDAVKVTPDPASPYLSVFVDHNEEKQASIGGTGTRRYRIYGIVMIQIFTPYGKGQVDSDAISGVVKGAFRGVNTGSDAIEFRHVRVQDIGQSGAWLQTNVVAEFEYDEIA